MSITAQKYLVGIMGLILVASVVATGYMDAQRRKSENPPPAAAGASLAPTPDPRLLRGIKVFEEFNCAGCHGPGGIGGIHNFNAQTAQTVPALIHVAESFTPAQLIAKIQDGVPVVPKFNPSGPTPPLHMPSFKELMTNDQLNDLVAYLLSLNPKNEHLGF